MIATPYRRTHRGLDLGGVVCDLIVGELKTVIVADRQPGTAAMIVLEALPIRVVRGTVDLDDESRTDQEIDAPDTVDLHLLRMGDPRCEQAESKERLTAALAQAGAPGKGTAMSTRKGSQNCGPLCGCDSLEEQGRLDDRESDNRGLVRDHVTDDRRK